MMMKRKLLISTISIIPSIVASQHVGCPTRDPDIKYSCPIERYCLWDSLTSQYTTHLKGNLGYIKRSWEYEDLVNHIEETKFSDLPFNIQSHILSFGYTEDSHNCCQTHYNSFLWDDFDEEQKVALRIMGYDQFTWDNHREDPIYTKYNWDSLPADVQYVASKYFCYTKEVWEKVPLSDWPEDAHLPGSTPRSSFDITSFELFTSAVTNPSPTPPEDTSTTSTFSSNVPDSSSTNDASDSNISQSQTTIVLQDSTHSDESSETLIVTDLVMEAEVHDLETDQQLGEEQQESNSVFQDSETALDQNQEIPLHGYDISTPTVYSEALDTVDTVMQIRDYSRYFEEWDDDYGYGDDSNTDTRKMDKDKANNGKNKDGGDKDKDKNKAEKDKNKDKDKDKNKNKSVDIVEDDAGRGFGIFKGGEKDNDDEVDKDKDKNKDKDNDKKKCCGEGGNGSRFIVRSALIGLVLSAFSRASGGPSLASFAQELPGIAANITSTLPMPGNMTKLPVNFLSEVNDNEDIFDVLNTVVSDDDSTVSGDDTNTDFLVPQKFQDLVDFVQKVRDSRWFQFIQRIVIRYIAKKNGDETDDVWVVGVDDDDSRSSN